MSDSKDRRHAQAAFPAQLAETMMQRTAIGTALVTLAYVLSIAMQLVAEPVAVYLDKIQLAVGIAVLVVVLPTFIRYSRHKSRLGAACPQADGFMADAFSRAARKAFSLTFVFLVALQFVTRRHFTDLPAEFFINVILAFSLGIFSLTFFAQVRGINADDDNFDAAVDA